MADTWFSWSATDSSNTSVDGMSVNTGMSPGNVDNALRKIMAACRNSVASALQTFLAGTAALPIANGGTGATSAAAALTSLGALDDDYRDCPLVSKSSSFNIDNTERANAINYSGGAGTCTVRAFATHPVNSGAVYPLRNSGTGALTFDGSAVTMCVNGANTGSASAVMSPGGRATLMYWGGDVWSLDGNVT